MTERQSRPVLFVDGPLAGKWREVPADHYGGRFFEDIDPYDARGLPLRSGHYTFKTVRVRIGPTEATVEVAYSETLEGLDALIIRRLFTEEAANALLGLHVIA